MRRVSPPLALALGLLASLPAAAQSIGASQASAISVAPSVELASIALEALPAGSRLLVRGVEHVGDSVRLTVAASAEGASFVVEVAAETAASLGVAVGTVLSVAVVTGGHVLSQAGRVLAFIPDAATRALIHHRELQE
jgi:hypothetical protein